MARKKQKNSAVEKKLVGVADTVITAAQRSKDPTLAIPVRSLANINFNEKRGIIEMGRRKQARSFFNVGDRPARRRGGPSFPARSSP